MRNKKEKLITALVVLALIAALAVWVALSNGTLDYSAKYAGADLTANVEGIGRDDTYSLYSLKYADTPLATRDVEIDVFEYTDEANVEARADGLYMGDDSRATWKFTVPETGLYAVEMDYTTVPSRGVDIERAFSVNGEAPCEGAETLLFQRMWQDGAPVRKDNQNNEIRPTQVEVFGRQTAAFKDYLGYETEPFRFYFEAGENEVSLAAINEPVIVNGLRLKAIRENPTYAEYLSAHQAAGHADSNEARAYMQTVQGESAYLRSSPSLYAKYDRSSSATEPGSVKTTVLNYIGGDSWRNAGMWIEWVLDVPADGYYEITVKGRQNYQRGNVSSRIVYIDGEVPFKELECVAFGYANEWNLNTLSDENGTPYRFYLTKGEHTLRMEATMGDMGGVLSDLQDSIYRLNQMYRKIMVLTGATPDSFRDYRLDKVYPEVIEAMDLESKRLYAIIDRAIGFTGQMSNNMAAAQTLAAQLERFVEDPYDITRSFVNFKDNITSLGTAVQTISETKLDVDLIVVSGAEKPKSKPENVFTRLWHEIRSLTASYLVNYDALGDVYKDGEGALSVWILTGRDQSTVLKTMVDDTFTPETGIKVNIKLVDPNALLTAVVAGNGPDVVLSTDSWNPVNYAIRHAAEDLRQFPDIDSVLSDFYPSAYAPMEFNGGVYALPETQVYSLLFYRQDILDEYGLSVPKTWAELIGMFPTLQGANMSVGIPYPDIAAPNLSVLYSMIYQNGGQLYNEDARYTTIGEEPAVQAFDTYTSLYNDYGLPTIFDFVSRFRSGEMPIGIANYTTYNTLAISAPEIRGLWDFCPIPGTYRTDENGNTYLDSSVHSQGTGCMMIATDDEALKQCAWTFMKWWVSADSQVRFGREIEALLGSSARYATANTKALEQLSWNSSQLAVLKRAVEQAVGYREIAGGYYTGRHITNAIRKVINEKTDKRETVLDYARTINEEIVKKREEFGLPND